jgi:hypothetical protein
VRAAAGKAVLATPTAPLRGSLQQSAPAGPFMPHLTTHTPEAPVTDTLDKTDTAQPWYRNTSANLALTAIGTFLLGLAAISVILFFAHRSLQTHPIEGVVTATSYEPARDVHVTTMAGRVPVQTTKTKPECYRVDYKSQDGKQKSSCVYKWEWDGLKPGDKFKGTDVPNPAM